MHKALIKLLTHECDETRRDEQRALRTNAAAEHLVGEFVTGRILTSRTLGVSETMRSFMPCGIRIATYTSR
jgi:hypothetical protein